MGNNDYESPFFPNYFLYDFFCLLEWQTKYLNVLRKANAVLCLSKPPHCAKFVMSALFFNNHANDDVQHYIFFLQIS